MPIFRGRSSPENCPLHQETQWPRVLRTQGHWDPWRLSWKNTNQSGVTRKLTLTFFFPQIIFICFRCFTGLHLTPLTTQCQTNLSAANMAIATFPQLLGQQSEQQRKHHRKECTTLLATWGATTVTLFSWIVGQSA